MSVGFREYLSITRSEGDLLRAEDPVVAVVVPLSMFESAEILYLDEIALYFRLV